MTGKAGDSSQEALERNWKEFWEASRNRPSSMANYVDSNQSYSFCFVNCSLVSTTFRKRRPFSSHVAFRILQHVSQFCHARTKEAIVRFERCSFLWIFTFLKLCYYCFAFCLVSRPWILFPRFFIFFIAIFLIFFSLSVHRHKPIVICMARVNISQHTPFNTFSIFFMFIYKLSTPPLGRL